MSSTLVALASNLIAIHLSMIQLGLVCVPPFLKLFGLSNHDLFGSSITFRRALDGQTAR